MGASLLALAKSIYIVGFYRYRPYEHPIFFFVERSFSMLLIDLLMTKSLLNSDH